MSRNLLGQLEDSTISLAYDSHKIPSKDEIHSDSRSVETRKVQMPIPTTNFVSPSHTPPRLVPH
jgi:hypothetical protein